MLAIKYCDRLDVLQPDKRYKKIFIECVGSGAGIGNDLFFFAPEDNSFLPKRWIPLFYPQCGR